MRITAARLGLALPFQMIKSLRQRYFMKLLGSYIALSCVIIIGLCSIQIPYLYSSKQKEIDAYNLNSLEQTSMSADLLYRQVAQIFDMLISEPALIGFLYMRDISPIDEYAPYLVLRRLQSVHPSISSIFVYKNNRLLSSAYGTYLSYDENVLTQVKQAVENNVFFSVLSFPTPGLTINESGHMDSLSFFFYPQGYTMSDNAIVICISDDYLIEIINKISVVKDSYIIVVDADNTIIATSANGEGINYHALLQEMPDQANEYERFPVSIDNRKYTITYFKSNLLDWQYISITSQELDFASLTTIVYIVLGIGLSLLVIAIIISVFTARNMYKPLGMLMRKLNPHDHDSNEYQAIDDFIRRLADDNEMLSNQLVNTMPKLHEYQIREILDGTVTDIPKEYESLLFMRHCIILWRIDGGYMDKMDLLQYSIGNMLNEVLSEYGQTIQFKHDSRVHLTIFSSNEVIETDQLINRIMHVQHIFTAHFKHTFSCAIGETVSSFSDIRISKDNAFTLFKDRYVFGSNSIIYPEYAKIILCSRYPYPDGLDDKLVNVLKTIRIPEAEINLLFNYLSDKPYETCIFDLQNILRHMSRAFGSECLSELCFDDLTTFEDLMAVKVAMMQLCENIIQQEKNKADKKSDTIIKNIKIFVDENYSNPNFTLQMVSNAVGYSTGYVRKIFKSFTGVSLTEYVTKIRLEAAKDMLAHTSKTSTTICSEVGFNSNTYFTTMFKKHFGMTPIMFRQSKNDSYYATK